MSSVDNRIVNMHFNSNDFQAGAADSAEALTDLENTISSMSSSGGLEDMGKEIDGVASRFGALQIAGVAALATIAATATSTALSIGRDLLGSITSTVFGAGAQRAIDIQQAKFQFRGLGLDVKEVMENSLEAVQGTAFGLQEAATAATQFGGSGVKAGEDMTIALRSISGIAAQTGRSYSEIAQIMTSIAGTGKLNTQDLMQFGVRGLDVTGALAEEMGKTQQQIREMVSEGQIDFKTFAKVMDETFGKNATKANRTFTGALANMKAALSRIGADFFTPQIKAAGDIFNALGGVFDKVNTALDPLSKGFGKLTQAVTDNTVTFLESLKVAKILAPIIQGFKNIFSPLVALFETVGEAWLTVFPNQQHQGRRVIFTLASAFELITKPLAWLAELIPKLTPLFVAFFEVLRIGWTIAAGLGSIIGNLASKASEIGSSIVDGIMGGLTGSDISAQIVAFANSIVDWIKGALGINSPAEELVPVGTAIVEGIAQGMQQASQAIFEILGKIGGAIVDGFQKMFGGMDALDWTAFFNAILTGGLLLAMRGFFKTITGMAETMTTVFKPMEAAFGLLTESLEVMQTQVKAELIKSIAIAVGVLTASIVALSLLDPKKAAIGLGFMATSIGILLAAMYGINKINPAGIIAGSVALNLMSTAMVILAGAVAAFGQLNPDKIGKALGTMAISLTLMIGAVEYLGYLGPVAIAGAGAIFILSAAMVVLAGAVAAFGQLDSEKIGKALGTMAISLTLMVGAVEYLGALGPTAIAGAGAIFIVASAMVVLASAVAAFGAINPERIGQALVTMALSIALIVGATSALGAMGPAVLAGAGAIFIVASAMVVLAGALAVMGKVGPEKMSQGLVTIAVALGIFLAAAAVAAIAPVSAGLGVLAVSMLVFGAGVALVGAGLLAGATAFAIFTAVFATGTAALVSGLTAVIMLLPVFAHQLANAFVVFIETLAAAAPELRKAFGEIIEGILGTVRDTIPQWEKTFTAIIKSILRVVRELTPDFRKTIDVLIRAGLQTIRNNVDDYVDTGYAILKAFLRGIRDNIGELVDLGTQIVVQLIRGIGRNGPIIIEEATATITKFVRALPPAVRSLTAELSTVGFDIAIAIAQGLYDGIITRGVEMAKAAATKLADALPDWMKKVLGIDSPSKVAHWIGEMFVQGLADGIRDSIGRAVGATVALANAVIAAGDKLVAKAQRQSTRSQWAAEKAAAKARLSERQAKAAEKLAEKSPKNKELQEAAKTARQNADKQAKAAQAAQKRADAASQKVSDVQSFRAADDEGKGDILTARAGELSDRAIKKLAEANAAALAAKKVTGKERDRLKKEAEEAANAAKRLAKQSKDASERANDYYAKSVKDRIEALAAERKAREAEEAFENATDEEKIVILQSRMDAAQRRAAAAQKQSEALVNQARKLAKTDAARSMRLLDRAERLAAKANKSADEAKASLEEIERYSNQESSTDSGSTLQLSRSAMEDAASAIDRYTKSLEQAEEAAAAATPIYQFVQNNTSPESLTDTEIYRQTKNLLSVAEIKMEVPV